MKTQQKYKKLIITHLNQVTKVLNDIIFLLDNDLKFIFLNENFNKILSYNTKERIKTYFTEIVPKEKKEELNYKFNDILKNTSTQQIYTQIIHNNGSIIDVIINAEKVIYDNETFIQGSIKDVTNLVKAQRTIEKQHSQYKDLIESSAVGIMIFQNENIIFANQKSCEITGYSKSEFTKLKFWDLAIDKEIIKERGLQRIKGEDITEHFEIKIKHKKGHEIWLDYIGKKIMWFDKPAIMISAFDLTKQKLIEKELKNNKERYKALSDNTSEAIFFSQEGFGIDCNRTAAEMFGYSREEVMGMSGFMIVSDEYKDLVIQNMLNNYTKPYRVIGKKKDNTLFPIKIQGSEIIYNGAKTRVTIIQDISKEIENKKKLKLSEKKYKTLTESLTDCVFTVDSKGFFTYLNNAFKNITQYTPEEYLGKHFLEGIVPEYHEKIIKLFSIGMEKNTAFLYEIEIFNKNKERIPIEVSVSSLLDSNNNPLGRIGTFRDITKRKQQQQQLLKLQQSVEQSTSTIVITDSNGIIEYVNPAFKTSSGYNITEALGKNPKILKSDIHDNFFYKNLWNTISSGKTWKGELLNKKKNESLYWEKVIISPIVNKQGKISNYIAIKEDITEAKKIREDLIIAKKKAEENDMLKTAFLQNMSHEIRTPLNGILGFAELIKIGELEEEDIYNYADIITTSGNRLLNLINNILDISKIESGSFILNANTFYLNQLLSDIQKIMILKAEKKGLYLKMQYNLSDEKSLIKTDNEKLNQILMNLINNAIKFTEKGGITCNYFIKNEKIYFSIKDTGIGILKKQHEKIFNRFYQTNLTKSRRYEGAGLGLSISKGLVELLGGEIVVRSEKDKGSEFIFSIPYQTSI